MRQGLSIRGNLGPTLDCNFSKADLQRIVKVMEILEKEFPAEEGII